MGRSQVGTKRESRREQQLLRLIEALRARGWKARSGDASRPFDVLATRGERTLALVIRDVPDARHDHLRSRLAEALVTASAACASESGWMPVGIVVAPRITETMRARTAEAVVELAPGLKCDQFGWGLMDDQGFIELDIDDGGVAPRALVPVTTVARGPRRSDASLTSAVTQPSSFDPFSDLGQWLLKALLSSMLSADVITGTRRGPGEPPLLSAYSLAPWAGVSTATASRLIRWMREEGFLDPRGDGLRPHRTSELMKSWRGRHPGPGPATPACWMLPTRDTMARVHAALRKLAHDRPSSGSSAPVVTERAGLARVPPRACLATFTACDALQIGIVKGIAPRIYLERPAESMAALGLMPAPAGRSADVLVYRPPFPESIFRGHVTRDRVAACDAIQIWLDLAHERARGEEQARVLERGVLAPLFEEAGR